MSTVTDEQIVRLIERAQALQGSAVERALITSGMAEAAKTVAIWQELESTDAIAFYTYFVMLLTAAALEDGT